MISGEDAKKCQVWQRLAPSYLAPLRQKTSMSVGSAPSLEIEA
jgi:hypothetical protein